MKPVVLIAAAACALAGCNSSQPDATAQQSATDPAATASATTAPATASGAAAGAELPLTAQAFVDAAAASDNYELEAARIAQTSGTAPAVKAFAAMMLDDHRKSSAALKAALPKAGAVALDPQKLTPDQQVDLGGLQNAGADFDAVYARQQVAAHERTLAALRTYAASGDDKGLMAFAAKTIPVVEHHLEQARKLP